MLIDWFTVAAQLINFLILVALLKRFLYRPVLKALDEREKKISDELEHASASEKEAEKERSEWQRKNGEFEAERALMMKQAEKECAEKRQALLDGARSEYDALHTKLQETLRRQQNDAEEETMRQIRSEVFSIAGKVLDELAGISLEERIVQIFCERLRNAGEGEIKEMSSAFHEKSLQPVVRSRFPLKPEQQEMISSTVREIFGIDTAPSFETADSLRSGIELSMNGRRISWDLSYALEAMKRNAEGEADKAAPSTGTEHDTTHKAEPG
jgi:F-type H+-transporting ATPase subunit b